MSHEDVKSLRFQVKVTVTRMYTRMSHEDVKSLLLQVKATVTKMCHEDESRGCEEPTLPGRNYCHVPAVIRVVEGQL
jgi:hypothetical protein